MRKLTIKCDCCQSEIEEKDVFPLDIYVHVFPHFNRLAGHVKVINGRPYSTSGRTERRGFCLPCYNHLMEKFFCEIKEYGEINMETEIIYLDGSKHFDGSDKRTYEDPSETFRTKRVPKKYVVKKV